jgi:hypothetical protein
MNIALLAALACPALMCGPMAFGMIRARLRRRPSAAPTALETRAGADEQASARA